MIPRRKQPIRRMDLVEWWRALFSAGAHDRPTVTAFETAFAQYLDGRFARATASGRDALELALRASPAAPGDEVLIPAYTLGELLPVIERTGLRPVPVDIDPDTFNLDVGLLERRLTGRTRVIVATHLLGAPCDIERIIAVAKDRGLFVIEDCAHALGARVGGRPVGTFGDAALFSFEASKALPTYGGGMVVTNRAEVMAPIAAVLDRRAFRRWPALRKTLSTWIEEAAIRGPWYGPAARILFSERFIPAFERFYRGRHHRLRGPGVAFSAFQSRLGLVRLAEVDARNERMNQRWTDLAAGLPPWLTPQRREAIGTPAFYNFVATSQIPPRDLRERLLRLGIDIGVGSEIEDDCATRLGSTDCPVAAWVHKRAVLLPCYEGLRDSETSHLRFALASIAGPTTSPTDADGRSK